MMITVLLLLSILLIVVFTTRFNLHPFLALIMVASHVNDSFFWVVTQMSGMDVKTGYKLMTTGTICMGVLACTIIWIIGLIVL